MSMQAISTIQDTKFFDKPSSCISHYEKIHWTKKIISLIKSFGTFLAYALNRISLVLRRIDKKIDPLTKTHTGLYKKRLVVCVHGLNNSPIEFKKIIDEIKKGNLSETNIFIPRVLQNGNGELDEMVKPIFEEIAKWAETSCEKELVLIGISNGARIARALEAKIAKSYFNTNIKKLRFISIVGACKGSSLASFAKKRHLSWLMSKNIAKEMPTNSERNKQLDKDWLNALSSGPEREYTFFASPHDWQVTNYSSSLMEVNGHKAQYAIIPGHGHVSMANAVAKIIAKIILI